MQDLDFISRAILVDSRMFAKVDATLRGDRAVPLRFARRASAVDRFLLCKGFRIAGCKRSLAHSAVA